ncbi:MAG: PadR family transcriptional regulator [Candidatus Muiribacterium halophilum]|uniref:PadR family transcriptional regulator n=1 Tax=Muiribacterium halophilum TaxID=2053465 RepID=A0A2N5ZNA7_MUIH1|nr:MAG: PadR family transcriptional regulator [Candidatus Muirbacterium halophilum]
MANSQLRKGVLELCVLAVINKKDRYGYEIVNNISKHISVSKGTIYPILSRLKKQGYFENYLEESAEGPVRKYYKITEKGKDFLKQAIEEYKEITSGVIKIIE